MPQRVADDIKLDDALPPRQVADDIKLDAASAATGEPSTTWGGAATALARGLAPVASGVGLGAGIGAGAGALGGPVGAAGGAVAGAGAIGLTDLLLGSWNALAGATGLPKTKTPQDITDKLIDLIGGKPKNEQSSVERILESTASGASTTAGMGKLGETMARSTLPSVFRGAGAKMAEKPAVSAISGALGGAGSQATGEYVSDNPLMQLLGGLLAGGAVPAAFEKAARPTGALTDKLGLPTPQFVTDRATRRTNRTENEAREVISERFNRGVRGGAPPAADVVEQLRAAKAEGQPFSLVDTDNTEVRSLMGKTYRQGGAARNMFRDFSDERTGLSMRDRIKDSFNKYFSPDSASDTAEDLAALRSTTGKPLWTITKQGGSLAPLQQQYETAWNEVAQREVAASRAVAQAQNKITIARGRQDINWNVYSTSGANSAYVEAEQELADAQKALATVRQDKEFTLEKLRTSQIDAATNAPGGIWSPYLERFRRSPDLQSFLRTGFAIERRDALAHNEVFNPLDYALNDKGELIRTPNMRTWIVAKTGLDQKIQDMIDKELANNPGKRLSKNANSWIGVRNSLVEELDKLNPAYKMAREIWSGHTTSLQSLIDGERFLKVHPEDIKQQFRDLSDGDKQFYLMGVKRQLENKLRGVSQETQDKSRIIDRNVRERIEAMFGPDNPEMKQFMDRIERESTMKKTGNKITSGSDSAERLADDSETKAWMGAVADFLRMGYHYSHGNLPLAGGMALRGAKNLIRDRPDAARNEAITRLMISPDIDSLIAQGKAAQGTGSQLFPLESYPPSLTSRFLPGALIGTGVSFNNEPPPDLGFSWGASPPSR